MASLKIHYKIDDWRLLKRLLIDSSKLSLKTVLHNSNLFWPVAIDYPAYIKKLIPTWSNLWWVNYDKFKWQISDDVQVIVILLRLQQGYTKFCCFLCLWDSYAKQHHYKQKDWSMHQSIQPETHNGYNMIMNSRYSMKRCLD